MTPNHRQQNFFKIDKLDNIKMKGFPHIRGHYRQNEEVIHAMRKKIANYVSEKGLRSKINRTTTTTTIFK